MIKSTWQNGVPPCDGIWEIFVPEHEGLKSDGKYYARFKDGKWGAGHGTVLGVQNRVNQDQYPPNNNPDNPRLWRGLIDE